MAAPARNDPVELIRAAVGAQAQAIGAGPELSPEVVVERPAKPEFGDYSTNAAMVLAPALKASPRDIASQLADALQGAGYGWLDRVEIAGPGFVNFHLAPAFYREAVVAIGVDPEAFGKPADGETERILLEFVSANPTGPLTAAGGRHAAFGDTLARVLEFLGHDVIREYLLNDAGGQIDRFAGSIAARMRGEEPPEDGYAGEYVADLARDFAAAGADPGDLDDLGRRGVEAMKSQIQQTLSRFGVDFDVWFSEREVHEDGRLEATLDRLRESDLVYESEGASWLRTTSFGDDKDRVLMRTNGEPTYFAADIAYHADKFGRADRLIDVWGADHHGYAPRMKAAIEALGADPALFQVIFLQLVNLVEAGERAQMSKRRGDFARLDELVDDIGVDAARFFMLQRSPDVPLDLDLDLARETTRENPVFYVQYAHARISKILRDTELSVDLESAGARTVPLEPSERELIAKLLEMPGVIAEAGERRAPHRLCAYSRELATAFHAFYRDCHVIGEEPDVEQARLAVCGATGSVIRRVLGLMGVSAPERM